MCLANLSNPSAAAQASLDANAMRGEWLQAVAQGLVTLPELIEQAVVPEYAPLKRIPLYRAVNAHLDSLSRDQHRDQGDSSEDEWLPTSRQIIERMLHTLGSKKHWLKVRIIDLVRIQKSSATVLALVEALLAQAGSTRYSAPWDGYPLSLPPAMENL